MAYRDEIARLEAMHAANPEGRVFAHLAEAYRKGGELERARDVLKTGLERHPGYASAHVVLGRVLLDLSDRDAADAAFRRVLELDPHNMVALRARADIAHETGNRDEALAHYRELLALDSSDEHASLRILEIESRPAPPPVREAVPAAPPAAEGAPRETPAPSAPIEPPAPEPAHAAGTSSVEEAAPQDAVPEYGEASLPAIGDDAIEPVPELEGMEPAPGSVADTQSDGDVDLGLAGMLEPTDIGTPAGAAAAATESPTESPAEARAEAPTEAPDAVLDLAGLEGAFAIPDAEGGDELDLPGYDEIAADATPAPAAPVPTAPADEPAPAPAPMAMAPAEPPAAPSAAAEQPAAAEEPAAAEPPAPAPAWPAPVQDIDSLWATYDDGAAVALPNIGPELITETIADLYAQQGLHARAAEVYRRLLETRQGDAKIQQKLDAARAALSASEAAIGTWAARTEAERQQSPADVGAPARAADAPKTDAEDVFDLPPADAEPEPARFDVPEIASPSAPPLVTAADIGLETIGGGDMLTPPAADDTDALEGVESAWTGGGGAAANTDSPFGWAEPEAAPEQSTIGEYLESLLAWQPAAEPASAAPEPASAAPELAAAPEPAAAPDAPVTAEPPAFMASAPPANTAPSSSPVEPFDDIEALFGPPPPIADEIEELFGPASRASAPDPFAAATFLDPQPSTPEPAAAETAAPSPEAPKPAASEYPFDEIDALFTDVPAEPATPRVGAPEPPAPVAPPPVAPPPVAPPPASSLAPPPSGAAGGSAAGSARATGSAFEWDPFAELPVAQPPAPTPSASSAPEPAPADTPAGGADDDEDIDMFRAWLQSLKR